MLYWSHRSFRRPNLSVCPAPGVPGGKKAHTNDLNNSHQRLIYFEMKTIFTSYNVSKYSVWSVIFLHLRWQSIAKEASQLLCPLWLVCPTVRRPDSDNNRIRVKMDIFKLSERVFWKCCPFRFSYHLVLGSKDGIAWDCAQAGERQAELMRQKLTLKSLSI